jgi:2-dehydro-3-deoxy-D-arabinonate dehydratase
MLITRYGHARGGAAVGLERDDKIVPLDGLPSLGELLRLPLDAIRARCEKAAGGQTIDRATVRLLPPVDSLMEVWAAGVTYRRSREARVEESDRAADVYELVYDADRPELFFKSVAWRVTGHGEQISVRRDSEINVPEPELAVVLNAHGETVGYTICNDVSSRSIEGANPLYLPQAKVYLGACAVGPGIRPAWEVADPFALTIQMGIERAGTTVWQGQASTADLRRDLSDLASFLVREDCFPEGAVLSTGTSLVPDLPFTLVPGDTVRIEIDEVGVLESRVVGGRDAMRWVVEAADDPARPCPTPTVSSTPLTSGNKR